MQHPHQRQVKLLDQLPSFHIHNDEHIHESVHENDRRGNGYVQESEFAQGNGCVQENESVQGNGSVQENENDPIHENVLQYVNVHESEHIQSEDQLQVQHQPPSFHSDSGHKKDNHKLYGQHSYEHVQGDEQLHGHVHDNTRDEHLHQDLLEHQELLPSSGGS